MPADTPFKCRHVPPSSIVMAVRWYLRYRLSYRDVQEMLAKRGVNIDHSTIYRWVQRHSPEMDERCRTKWQATNDSWRVDETYIRVGGVWRYLYRAVDSV
ncbi:MAG: IS6 family transposase, partial [Cyanobacteria bacterium P01_F01_bin.3]